MIPRRMEGIYVSDFLICAGCETELKWFLARCPVCNTPMQRAVPTDDPEETGEDFETDDE